MALPKLDMNSIKNWFLEKPIRIVIGVAILVGLISLPFVVSGVSDWWFKRSVEKQKEQIKNLATEADTIAEDIRQKELERAKKLGEAEQLTKQLARDQENANTAVANTDTAIENWKKAANANSNSNVNAQQLEEILKKIE